MLQDHVISYMRFWRQLLLQPYPSIYISNEKNSLSLLIPFTLRNGSIIIFNPYISIEIPYQAQVIISLFLYCEREYIRKS